MKRIAVIGLGLIGGSCCAALKKCPVDVHITGFSASRNTLKIALSKGLIDKAAKSVSESMKNSEVVVISVPVGSFYSVFSEIAFSRENDSIVTDVGSTKANIIGDVKTILGGIPKKNDKFRLAKKNCKNFKAFIFGNNYKEFKKHLKNKMFVTNFVKLKDVLKYFAVSRVFSEKPLAQQTTFGRPQLRRARSVTFCQASSKSRCIRVFPFTIR